MNKKYHAWMLRIIQNGGEEDKVWRASLEDPHTRERMGFDTLEALYEFIEQSIDSSIHAEGTQRRISDFINSPSKPGT
jgi:hypothetical protein